MYDSLLESLEFFSSQDKTITLQNAFDEQIRNFRFHEAFRNRSVNMRAEASFYQSYFLVKSNGCKTDLNEFRKIFISNTNTNDLYHDLFLRLCVANNLIVDLMPDLQRGINTKRKSDISLKYLLPKLHSVISISDKLGIPRQDEAPLSFHITSAPCNEELLNRIKILDFLFSSPSLKNTHIRTAIFFAELLLSSPFIDSNYEIAIILTRLLLCKTGADPTGCIIFDTNFSPINNVFINKLKHYSTGNIDYINDWICYFLESINNSFDSLNSIANSVLAKKLPNWQ